MGIVNATPDSFSDGGERSRPRGARRARAGAAADGRGPARRRRRVGARRPPGRVARTRRSTRVVPLIARAGGRARRARLGRHLQARGGRGGDRGGRGRSSTTSPGCATRRWPTCARAPAPALVVMHTRVAPKGTLLDPGAYDDVVADVVGVPARADGASRRARRGVRSSSCSTRGRTSPRRRRRPSRCCGGSTRCARWGARCCWRSRARTSSARSPAAPPRERLARRRSRRVAYGVDAGARGAARARRRGAPRDFLAVRAVLRGERELGAGRGAHARSATLTVPPHPR